MFNLELFVTLIFTVNLYFENINTILCLNQIHEMFYFVIIKCLDCRIKERIIEMYKINTIKT